MLWTNKLIDIVVQFKHSTDNINAINIINNKYNPCITEALIKCKIRTHSVLCYQRTQL